MKNILTLLLLLCLAVSVSGALLFDADSDALTHANSSTYDSIGDTGTTCLWIYPTDDTARQALFIRSDLGNTYYEGNWRADLGGDNFEFDRQRATTDIYVAAAAANFANYGLNKWIFVCTVFNVAGAASDQKILIGDLDSPVAEPSAYASQDAGSGAASTTWGTNPFYIGSTTNTTREFHGRVAFAIVTNTALTLDQMTSLQWFPRPIPGTVLCAHYGFPDTTSVDCTGNAVTITPTGLTNTDHVPLGNLFGMLKPVAFDYGG